MNGGFPPRVRGEVPSFICALFDPGLGMGGWFRAFDWVFFVLFFVLVFQTDNPCQWTTKSI